MSPLLYLFNELLVLHTFLLTCQGLLFRINPYYFNKGGKAISTYINDTINDRSGTGKRVSSRWLLCFGKIPVLGIRTRVSKFSSNVRIIFEISNKASV